MLTVDDIKFANVILIIKLFYYFIFTLELKHRVVDKVLYQWQPGLTAYIHAVNSALFIYLLLIIAHKVHKTTYI